MFTRENGKLTPRVAVRLLYETGVTELQEEACVRAIMRSKDDHWDGEPPTLKDEMMQPHMPAEGVPWNHPDRGCNEYQPSTWYKPQT